MQDTEARKAIIRLRQDFELLLDEIARADTLEDVQRAISRMARSVPVTTPER